MYYSTLCLFLKDKDYMLVANNLKKHVDSSPYLPTIADLVKEDKIYSSVPGVEETRLMIAEREKERENHVPSNPEYIKKLIAETRAKLMEVELNEIERDYKRACELRSRE